MSRAALATHLALLLVLSARALTAGELWGPGEDGIIFSEVHYHPPGDVAEEEFVEVHNRGVRWVDLSGWTLAGGVEFELPAGTVLAPGGYLAIAARAAALSERPGAGRIVGDFKGRLADGGEVLELRNRAGRTVASLHYRDGRGHRGGLWPRSADGRGSSLELIAAHPEWDHPWRWAASLAVGGTPGAANSVAEELDTAARPAPPARRGAGGASSEGGRVSIHEVFLGPGEPFVELASSGTSAARLDGFRLAAERSVALSGTIAPGKLLLVDAPGTVELLAALSTSGEGGKEDRGLRLYGPSGELLDAIEIPRLPPGASAGRHPQRSGETVVLPGPTPGKPNAVPEPPRLVINEINYHGARSDGGDEFIEIHNPGKARAALEGWYLDGGVRFEFPAEAALAAGAYAVVARNPELLRGAHASLAAGASVFGPWRGRLSNKSETIVLRDRWGSDVDEVRYADRPPWPRDADGGGASLELRHPAIDNRFGEAWARGGPGGSPGSANRNLQELVPPFVAGVRHEPAVPAPGDTITVHAHVVSSRTPAEVSLAYHELGSEARPQVKRMSDRGELDDGAARDGHFAARFKLPARMPDGTVIAYRIVVQHASGKVESFPEASREYLVPVEPAAKRSTAIPSYYVLMNPDGAERFAKQPRTADDWYPCTFVAAASGPGVRDDSGAVRHGAFIRQRGNNSRRPADGRMSYRLRLAGGEYFDGRDRFVLNAFDSHRQCAGGRLLRAAGLPAPRVTTVRLSLPGSEDSRYLDVEVVDENFLERVFGSSEGDLFRGRRGSPFGADFSFHGRDDVGSYLKVYQRVNKKKSRDLSRLFDLLETLAVEDEAAYFERVAKVLDVEEWATYFAANNLLGNTEGGLSVAEPDDYYQALRPDDGRWVLVPWDNDSTFGDSRQPLFRPQLPALRRFLRHPRVAPLYHRGVRELIDGPLSGAGFALEELSLARTFLADDVASLERFARERQVDLREGYVLWPHAGLGGAGGGEGGGFGSRLFAPSAPAEALLWGYADPALAFGVEVGGARANYDPVRGEWSAKLAIAAGPNDVWVRSLDGRGEPVSMVAIRVEAGRSPARVPPLVEGSAVWSQARGPYFLGGTVTVEAGSTLRIERGTEVVCGPRALLVVRGRLEVEGTSGDPVSFRTQSWKSPWHGISFVETAVSANLEEQVLACARFEGGEESLEPAPRAFLDARGVKLRLEGCVLRGIRGRALAVSKGALEMRGGVVTDSRHGIVVEDATVVLEGGRLSAIAGDGVELRRLRGKVSRLKGCTLQEVQGVALSVAGSAVTLDGVLASGSAVALAAKDGARVEGRGLVLAANGVALLADRQPWGEPSPAPAASAPKRSEVRIEHSVLCPNGVEVLAGRGAVVTLEACHLERVQALAPAVAVKDARARSDRFRSPLAGDFRAPSGD